MSTAGDRIEGVAAELREAFAAGVTKDLDWRRGQLQALQRLCRENRRELLEAVERDIGRIAAETDFAEVGATVAECERALEGLEEWASPQAKNVPLFAQPASGYTVPEPFGVVLLAAPWNYPIRMTLFIAVGALAAGNCVVIKPSEVSAHTSAALARLVPRYLDPRCVRCVEGAVPETQALLRQQWDYIFYTGNTAVGRIFMRAAAESLCPVTLELGGKSPVVVAADADVAVAARRIANGKWTNAGQVCVAPDYVLVARERKAELLAALRAAVAEFYGADARQSGDYARVINERHTRRLEGLLESERARVVLGGASDAAAHFMEPTIVDEPALDSPLMREEIFGPILPVLAVDSVDEAVAFINARPKPLALYVFSAARATADAVVARTSSGGVGVNVCVLQIACPELPFGGVGASGMGAYNARHTFDTFSHHKTVLAKGTWPDLKGAYPPFTAKKRAAMHSIAEGIKIPLKAKLLGGAVAAGVAWGLRSRL